MGKRSEILYLKKKKNLKSIHTIAIFPTLSNIYTIDFDFPSFILSFKMRNCILGNSHLVAKSDGIVHCHPNFPSYWCHIHLISPPSNFLRTPMTLFKVMPKFPF